MVKTKSKKVEVPVLGKLPEARREARRSNQRGEGADGEGGDGDAAADARSDAPEARPAPAPPMTGKRKWSIALAAHAAPPVVFAVAVAP